MDEDAIYNRHLEVFLLWACRETGVVEALLAEPRSAAAVAEKTGITDRAAAIALEGLRDAGYVERAGDDYRPTDDLRVFDPETAPLDRGKLPHRVDSLATYMRLPETMRTGTPPDHTDEGFRNYVGAMAAIDDATVREVVTTAERVHPRPETVLDVGGGPGRFGAEFARRGADVTLVDRPRVLALLEDHHADLDVDVVPGNAQETLPAGFEVVFSARMTSGFTPDEIRTYFANAHRALDPGGTFVCIERIRGRSALAARFAVHMLAGFPAGDTYEASVYRDALTAAGFDAVDVREVPRTEFQAVVGRKAE